MVVGARVRIRVIRLISGQGGQVTAGTTGGEVVEEEKGTGTSRQTVTVSILGQGSQLLGVKGGGHVIRLG